MFNHRKTADLITKAPDRVTTIIPAVGISYYDTMLPLSGFSKACASFNSFFKEPLEDKMLLTLCQAVIDDHRDQVKSILIEKPELLLMQPPLKWMIESKFTFQKFYAEPPLLMAAKRKQIEMMKLMFDCCNQSFSVDEAKRAKAAALSAWSPYSIQQHGRGEKAMLVPSHYAKLALEWVEVFSKETAPERLSEKTESTLQLLFNTLLPDEAVRLDDYRDVELLLLALYKAYDDHFNTFRNWNQRDAFCIRVIGLVQSVLPPETAMIFCEGIENVVTALSKGKERNLGERALKHLLKDETPFYRVSRHSREGLGSRFLCGIYGGRCGAAVGGAAALEFLYQAKTSILQDLCSLSRGVSLDRL